MHKGGRIRVEQSGTQVESLGTKEGLSRESYGCIILIGLFLYLFFESIYEKSGNRGKKMQKFA